MLNSAQAVLEGQIKDIYSAERQLLRALPKLAKASKNEALKRAFESHLEETKVQIDRLEQVAELLDMKPSGKKCMGMEGLIAEGAEATEEDGDDACVDAAIIAAAQRVEHYEIAAYGTARAIAEMMGKRKVVKLLQATLDEESAADEKLSQISLREVLAAIQNNDESSKPED